VRSPEHVTFYRLPLPRGRTDSAVEATESLSRRNGTKGGSWFALRCRTTKAKLSVMNHFRFRLIDTAGGEIGIIEDPRTLIQLGESVELPDGSTGIVVDVYDDEDGKKGDVQATLAVAE
jgi:hypothetical protein